MFEDILHLLVVVGIVRVKVGQDFVLISEKSFHLQEGIAVREFAAEYAWLGQISRKR